MLCIYHISLSVYIYIYILKRLRRCTAAPCLLAPCAGSCSRRWLPRFWPRFLICMAETAVCSFIWFSWVRKASLKKKQAGLLWHVSGWAWRARGTRKNMQKTITKNTKNMQNWYLNRLKSDIWTPPGRRRGFTKEKKPFRRISGACFGPFWLHFGLPYGLPGRALGDHGGAKTRPEAEKGMKKRCLRQGSEKKRFQARF